MIPCYLPSFTFFLYALLLQFGVPFWESLIPFLVAEGTAATAQAFWRRRLEGDERLRRS